MDIYTRIGLVKKGPICEIVTEEELMSLFESSSSPTHYIGFEISGKVHIGSGLLTAMLLKDFMKAGIRPTIFLADYHAWINGKLGGDLEKIQQVAKGYFKSAFLSLGLEEGKVRYVLASEIYDADYWKEVLRISKDTSISRMLRCTTIMGRSQKEALDCASVLYPAMQAADMRLLDVDIAHAGMDQRKVHMLAREISSKHGWKKKPVAIHHALLMGLNGPQRMGIGQDEKEDLEISSKMSKSKPGSCIFIHDSEEEIRKKLKGAYCPEKSEENNPVLEICKHFVFPQASLRVERPAKFGGDAEFFSYSQLLEDYKAGKLHPADLKNAVAGFLAKALEPCRKHFEKRPELLEQVEEAAKR
ncbi:MAG: tyrosine--tRNA ligase [Candidatus Micrarchaeota archaeon]|nr:tyrosine--tRNA ligase [Candidatus Micrarchaeota archaeon]